MPINKSLLRKVRNYILAEPRRYEQGQWKIKDRIAPCGTAACIAGTVDLLAYPMIPPHVETVYSDHRKEKWFSEDLLYTGVGGRAKKALGLTDGQRMILFTPEPQNYWPEPFASRWLESLKRMKTAERRTIQARIAADYINHIIRTGKVR